MPEKQTIQRARQARREGKRPTTQASEFVREEMHHLQEGKHGAKSRQQAIAIGLSKARRAGVDLPPPGPGQAKRKTRQSARSAHRLGQQEGELSERKTSPTRRRRSTAGSRSTTHNRRSSTSRGSPPGRGSKTGGRRAATAGRTGRATTSRGRGTGRASTRRSRSTSRARR